jgi:hypothetical protein
MSQRHRTPALLQAHSGRSSIALAALLALPVGFFLLAAFTMAQKTNSLEPIGLLYLSLALVLAAISIACLSFLTSRRALVTVPILVERRNANT